jgi:hypothetical protein
MVEFNNREIATAFWLLVFLLFALKKKNIRESISRLLKSFVTPKILIPFIAYFVYVSLVLVFLQKIGYWNTELIKDSIYWFLFAGIIILGKSVNNPTSNNFWKQSIKDHFTVIVVLTLLINLYTFSLPIEFIIVPLSFIIVMTGAVAELKPEHGDVVGIIHKVEAIFGWSILAAAVFQAINDLQVLASIETLNQFLLPIILTVAVFPFIYLISIYVIYDQLWSRTIFKHPKDRIRAKNHIYYEVYPLSFMHSWCSTFQIHHSYNEYVCIFNNLLYSIPIAPNRYAA